MTINRNVVKISCPAVLLITERQLPLTDYMLKLFSGESELESPGDIYQKSFAAGTIDTIGGAQKVFGRKPSKH